MQTINDKNKFKYLLEGLLKTGSIKYYMCPTNETPTVFADMYCKPRVRVCGKVKTGKSRYCFR
jgi:hypothetical protein